MADNDVPVLAVTDFLSGSTASFDSPRAHQLGWTHVLYRALRAPTLREWCAQAKIVLPSNATKASCYANLAHSGVGPTGPHIEQEVGEVAPDGQLPPRGDAPPPVVVADPVDPAPAAASAAAAGQLSAEELAAFKSLLSSLSGKNQSEGPVIGALPVEAPVRTAAPVDLTGKEDDAPPVRTGDDIMPQSAEAAGVAPAVDQFSSQELQQLKALLGSGSVAGRAPDAGPVSAFSGPMALPDDSVATFKPTTRDVFSTPEWWNSWMLPADLRSAHTLEPTFRASWAKDLPIFEAFPQPVAYTKADLAGLDPVAKRLLSQTLPAIQKRALEVQKMRLFSLAQLELDIHSGQLSPSSDANTLFEVVETLQGVLQRSVFAEWDQLSRVTTEIRSTLLQRRTTTDVSLEELAGVVTPNLAFSAAEEERLQELQAKRAAADAVATRPKTSKPRSRQRGNGRGRGKSRARSRDRGRSPASRGGGGNGSQRYEDRYDQHSSYQSGQQRGGRRNPPYNHRGGRQQPRGGGRGGGGHNNSRNNNNNTYQSDSYDQEE